MNSRIGLTLGRGNTRDGTGRRASWRRRVRTREEGHGRGHGRGFQFVNPHVLIYLTVKGDDGKEVQWGGELTSPNRLARMGGAVKWHQSISEARRQHHGDGPSST